MNTIRGNAARANHEKLAATGYVDPQPFLVDQASHGQTEKCLAGIEV